MTRRERLEAHLEARLAALEGAESALVLGSGMAAVTCTLLALLRTGDHVLASRWLADDVRRLFERELPALGIEVTLVDPTETRAWRRGTRPRTRVIYVATPAACVLRLVDLDPARVLAQSLGLALVVDSTEGTPARIRPLGRGADIVVHANVGHLSGNLSLSAGVVCGAEGVIDEVREKRSIWSHSASSSTMTALEHGLSSLHVRARRQEASALAIARWAESQPAVSGVQYFGLASHADHALSTQTLDDAGALLSIELAAGGDAALAVSRRLRTFIRDAVTGGIDSRAHVTAEGALRLYVGLDDAQALIADLTQATE